LIEGAEAYAAEEDDFYDDFDGGDNDNKGTSNKGGKKGLF
jgi:hypothetical protein